MSRSLAFLLLILAHSANGQTAELSRSRPNGNNGPTRIWVSLYIINIEQIDSKEQSFTLDVVIKLKWQDPGLPVSKEPVPLDEIWHPNVQFFNLRDVEQRFAKEVTIVDGGTVLYTQRYYATLSSHLDFRDFPFDTQTLSISLLAFGYSPEEVELAFESAGGENEFSISDWRVEQVGATTSSYKANVFDESSGEIVRSRLDYQLKATRYIDFYWWKVVAPLMVILLLSWAVFWIEPSQIGAQIGVSGTSILALIAFLYKLDNNLPPVSYLTHMDHFIFTTLVLVLVSYFEALASSKLALKGKLQVAHTLDFYFRIGYPIILLIVLAVFWGWQ